jgi:lipoprotein-releasing system permease protein
MYKLLLCWRYLCTRYIALASVISVTLGVWAMIAVNSVMSGFTTEMRNRIHGILSDIVFESRSLEGFPDPEAHMEDIRKVAGEWIEGMTPTVNVPAMISFQFRGSPITQQVYVIGIDERTQSSVSDFAKYLQHPANREQMSFQLRDSGYDTVDHQATRSQRDRSQMAEAGWSIRRTRAFQEQLFRHESEASQPKPAPAAASSNPFAGVQTPGAETEPKTFDMSKEQHTGAVLGIALSCHRDKEGNDLFLLLPGEDMELFVPTAGTPPKAVHWNFTVVDLYESKMSEYDASFVFVPIKKLQELRGMHNSVSQIQIKLKPGVDLDMVRDRIRAAFSPHLYGVYTWRDKQGPLLAAVQTETAILNVLLFLIIAVAGFGILAVFFMIVVEKTRDIGILKSLGAPATGVMGIFLTYGLSLGLVGAGAGLVIGLLTVRYINEIANFLSLITGQPVFDPQIYYFYSIPAIVNPFTVAWIVAGAVFIAVMASVLPAMKAAMMRPVEALRYE